MEKQNMSEDLVSFIKLQIIEGQLNPGDRIIETKLAKELGISQTPVREAIRHLSGEGIIVIVPNKGPMVRTLDRKDVFEIYSLRSVLEGLAIRLATQRASDEAIHRIKDLYDKMKAKLTDESVSTLLQDSLQIHQSIIYLSEHTRLIRSYESISFQIALVNRILGKESTKQKEVDQHLELVEALMKRDPEYAESVMKKHIYRSYTEFSELSESDHRDMERHLWFNDDFTR
ncbi:GntR family transcriptional regulator [Paenibacillus koleovorans]|uniref:GntR family transcriptional regulator n=1 Tax=Paenibacillus koleovorans TaxID=121608 RepID=UPI0013E2964D|nr:GntR family transcriptional regulator [Paenibacillus koleovorans]